MKLRSISLVGAMLLLAPIISARQGLVAVKPDKPMETSPGLERLADFLKDRTLSIDEAVRLALITNHTLALASANLFIAQGKTSEAQAALNPTLGSALDVIRLNDAVANKTLLVDDPQNFNKPIGAEIVNQNVSLFRMVVIQ